MMHRIALIVGAAMLAGATAHAADAPELTGTWSGSGPSVSEDEGWEAARSANLQITEQRGPVFKGHVQYEGGEEDFVGVVQADGKNILISNDDGNVMATLISPSEMEVCYVEGGGDATAYCSMLKRSE
ncbi:MAG TPA: hypothetical protein VHL31_13010 [Geminicoccus sp.]|uniref:hypothetical protein n=1 Tax=Geminicoccus sp. TaxID=2024832 RepID=UPI002E302736|nr:hypothetical protein [Geminicoccus sp.]HEX2527200.1 hypothetical protein [Geminicoccus sp.]